MLIRLPVSSARPRHGASSNQGPLLVDYGLDPFELLCCGDRQRLQGLRGSLHGGSALTAIQQKASGYASLLQVLKHGWWAVLAAMSITTLSGFVLKNSMRKYPPLAAFQLLINGG